MTAQAAAYLPSSGIFGPTTGLDPLLFDDRHELRGSVAEDIMARLDRALRADGGLTGSEWQDNLKVYLAGGSASEWAGSRPNDEATDLDILIGVDYDGYRGSQPVGYEPKSDAEIDAELNACLRKRFNDPDWRPSFGGRWDLTGYVNPAAWDIRVIRPYAAWDISDGRWAVRPPHLPRHTSADFDPAVLSEARAVLAQARAILRMSEPARSRQARALWEHLHAERRRAFSIEGEGWEDPGNLIEKWLAYAPGSVLTRIRDLALAPRTAAREKPTKTKAQVNYRKATGKHCCGNCTMFRLHPPDFESGACTLVKGIIDEADVCDEWYPEKKGRTAAAGRGLTPADLEYQHARPQPGENLLTATHESLPEEGTVGGAYHGPGFAGEIHWWDDGEMEGVHVRPDLRRRGVATELWNRARQITPQLRHSRSQTSAGHAWAQKTASGSDGDHFVTCSKGHEHWGAHGAAGLLMRHKGPDGKIRYLLQKRSPEVDHPNTWSIPSGAKGKDESPEEGALREFREEMGAVPRGTTHHHTIASTDCGDWQFQTAVFDSPELFTPRGRGETEHEVAGSGWFTPAEAAKLDLHPAFAKSWDAVRKSAARRTAVTGHEISPGSGMIYLPVPPDLIDKVPGGVDDEPHITVVYLGKGLSDEAFGRALDAAATAARAHPPLAGLLKGTDTFEPSEASDQKVPAFVPAFVPGIERLRADLEHLSASEHKDYHPHVTLAYLERGDPVPPQHPERDVSFTHLHVKRGDQVVRFPLCG